MQIDDLGQTLSGGERRTRRAAPLLAALLSVSLLVSLQPCCELFASLFTRPGVESSAAPDGNGHAHGSTAPVPDKAGDNCGHSASSGADLAKVVPVIPSNAPSSHAGVAFVVSAVPIFSVVTRAVLPSAYHPSPPPFRVYLRFLHLLI